MSHRYFCFFGQRGKNIEYGEYNISLQDSNQSYTIFSLPGKGKEQLELSKQEFSAWLLEKRQSHRSSGGRLIVIAESDQSLQIENFTESGSSYQAADNFLVLESVYAPTWQAAKENSLTLSPNSYIIYPTDKKSETTLKNFFEQLADLPEDQAQLMLYSLRFGSINERIQQIEQANNQPQVIQPVDSKLPIINLSLVVVALLILVYLLIKPEPINNDYTNTLQSIDRDIKKTTTAINQLESQVRNKFENVRDRFDKVSQDLELLISTQPIQESDKPAEPVADEEVAAEEKNVQQN